MVSPKGEFFLSLFFVSRSLPLPAYQHLFLTFFLLRVSVSSSYAEMVVSTEESFRRLLETMPQCKINGEKLECRHASRRNLAEFEAQARKRK